MRELPVAHAHARLGDVGGVVGQHGDEELAGQVRMTDRERDPRAAGDAVVDLDEQSRAPQPLGQIDHQAVRARGVAGHRGVHGDAVLVAAARCGERQQVREQAGAGSAQPLGIQLIGREAGDHGEPMPGRAQGIEQHRLTAGAADRTEPVQHPAVRRLAEADREDDGLAPQPRYAREVGHDERFGSPGVEEGRERGVVPHLGEDRLPDAIGVGGRRRDDREGLLGSRERVRDGELDDVLHLSPGAVDGAGTRVGHARPVHHLEAHERYRLRQRGGLEDARIAVLGKERGQIRVAPGRVRAQREAGQHGGELSNGRPGSAPRIADDDDLAPTHQRGEGDLEGEVLDGVEHDKVDGPARGQQLGYEHRRCCQHGPQPADQVRVPPDGVPQAGQPVLDELAEQRLGLLAVRGQDCRDMTDDGGAHRSRQARHLFEVESPVLGGEAGQRRSVEPGEGRVGPEQLVEHGAPPREIELGAHESGPDAPAGEIRQQRIEAGAAQRADQRGPFGQHVERGPVSQQAAEPLRELRQGRPREPTPSRRCGQRSLEVLEVVRDQAVLRLDRNETRRQLRPATARAVRLPDFTLGLHLDERCVQIGDRPARPGHVLGLFAQPASVQAAHGGVVLGAPSLRRRGDDEVGGGALEDHGLEHVERPTDAAEHPQLFAPGGDGRRGRQAGGHRDLLGARSEDGQRTVHQPFDPGDGIVGRRGGDEVCAEPWRLGWAERERPEGRGPGQVYRERRAPWRIEHPGDVGCQARGGLRCGPRRGQAGQGLQRVIGGGTPRLTRLVQRGHVAAELVAARDQVAAQAGDAARVGRRRLEGHGTEEATRDGGPPPGVGRDVEQEVVEAELAEPRRERGRRAAMARDVQHAATGRGSLGDDGGERPGRVAARGCVDEEVAAGGQDVQHVALHGVEIADPTLGSRVAVAAHGLGQGSGQPTEGGLVTGERGDDLMAVQRGRRLVQVFHEHGPRMHERAHEQSFGELELLEHRRTERVEPVERGSRVETRARERPAGDRDRVEQGAATPERAGEDRVHFEGGLQPELVVALAAAARVQRHGSQQHGCAHCPRGGVD